MKKSIVNQLTIFPRVLEYNYSQAEEEDIDKFQLRKCVHFKKLMLEISQGGASIGIPIPVGYESSMVSHFSFPVIILTSYSRKYSV
jgi:hypothetical protein